MSALLGGRQLCIFDQFCDHELGAPIHSHAVEEARSIIPFLNSFNASR